MVGAVDERELLEVLMVAAQVLVGRSGARYLNVRLHVGKRIRCGFALYVVSRAVNLRLALTAARD